MRGSQSLAGITQTAGILSGKMGGNSFEKKSGKIKEKPKGGLKVK